MDNADLNSRLMAGLGLDLPPVAVTFTDSEGAAAPAAEPAPSACAYWRRAETAMFYASAAQHAACAVGSMVMGFAPSGETAERLAGLVTDMSASQYLEPDEPAQIPTVSPAHAGILYGPLASCAAQPDLVLIWVSPDQAMLCNEAMGTAAWGTAAPTVTGRPGCAALPVALRTAKPVISFGCTGMRTFTEIGQDKLLTVIPGSGLRGFVAAIEKHAAANAHMQAHYDNELAAGAPPDVG